MSERAVLDAIGVALSFGGTTALDGVDLRIEPGAIHGLIGPNGSGKTSFVNCCTGLYRPSGGSISVLGHDVASLRPWEIARLGVTRTFQRSTLIDDGTVMENVLVAVDASMRAGGTGERGTSTPRRAAASIARDALSAVGILNSASARVGELPLGVQRLVELARTLAFAPALLILDEPTAGMNVSEKAYISEVVRALPSGRGLTVLLIEHDARFIAATCDTVTCLNFGRMIAHGSPDLVYGDAAVREAYLGS